MSGMGTPVMSPAVGQSMAASPLSKLLYIELYKMYTGIVLLSLQQLFLFLHTLQTGYVSIHRVQTYV